MDNLDLFTSACNKKDLTQALLLIEEIANPEKCLEIAIRQSYVLIVEILLETSNFNPDKLRGCLFEAVVTGNVEVVEIFLKKDIKISKSTNRTILKEAIKTKNQDLIRTLLANGFTFKGEGKKCMGDAVELGDLDIIKVILDSGFELNEVDADKLLKRGMSNTVDCILKAFHKERFDIVDLFFERGLNLSLYAKPIASYAIGKCNSNILQMVMDVKPDLFVPSEKSWSCSSTILGKVIGSGSKALIEYVVIHGENVDILNAKVLKLASENCGVAVIEYLESMGADFSDPEYFHFAALNNNKPLMEMFLGRSMDITGIDAILEPFMRRNDVEMIKRLVDLGAKLDVRLGYCHAIEASNLDLVKFYHARGADLDDQGVFNLAMENSKVGVVKYLYENSSKLVIEMAVLSSVKDPETFDYILSMSDLTEDEKDLHRDRVYKVKSKPNIIPSTKPDSDFYSTYGITDQQIEEYIAGNKN